MCSVSPRLVRTEFTRGIFPDDPKKAEAIFDRGNCLEPADVSQAILYILSSSPRVEVQDVRLSPVGGIY